MFDKEKMIDNDIVDCRGVTTVCTQRESKYLDRIFSTLCTFSFYSSKQYNMKYSIRWREEKGILSAFQQKSSSGHYEPRSLEVNKLPFYLTLETSNTCRVYV